MIPTVTRCPYSGSQQSRFAQQLSAGGLSFRFAVMQRFLKSQGMPRDLMQLGGQTVIGVHDPWSEDGSRGISDFLRFAGYGDEVSPLPNRAIAVLVASTAATYSSMCKAASFVANHPSANLVLGPPTYATQHIAVGGQAHEIRTRVDVPQVIMRTDSAAESAIVNEINRELRAVHLRNGMQLSDLHTRYKIVANCRQGTLPWTLPVTASSPVAQQVQAQLTQLRFCRAHRRWLSLWSCCHTKS